MRYQLERLLLTDYFLLRFRIELTMIVSIVSCSDVLQLTCMHCESLCDKPLTVRFHEGLFKQSYACRSFACA